MGNRSVRLRRARWGLAATALGAAAFVVAALAPAVLAQGQQAPASPPGDGAGQQPQQAVVEFVGGTGQMPAGAAVGWAALRENRLVFEPPSPWRVRILYGDTVAVADRLEVDQGRGLAILGGSVYVSQAGTEVWAERMEAELDRQVFRFERNVRALQALQPQENGAGAAGPAGGAGNAGGAGAPGANPATREIQAESLEIDMREGILIARGSVRLVQSDPRIEAEAESLRFDEGAQQLVLEGNVRGRQDRSTFEAIPRAEVDLEAETLRVIGGGRFTFTIDSTGSQAAPAESGAPQG